MTLPMRNSRAISAACKRPRAAIGDHREIGGIEAALGRHPAHHMRHLGDGDAQDAVGRFQRAEAERLGDLRFDRLARAVKIELHLAAEKAIGRQPAEHEIAVGHGRLGAALAVADRARRAPALSGPTRSAPASMRAMLPPPVPTS